MSLLSAITFLTPAALAALLALPVIWWLLRFTPPRPETVRFPAIRLLLGLTNREDQPDKTPWWLLLLRLLMAAFVILGVAQPLFAPDRAAELDRTPLLLVVDDSWAAARDWETRQAVMADILGSAAAAGTPVTLATTTPQLRRQSLEAAAPADLKARAAALRPRAFDPDRPGMLKQLQDAFGTVKALRVTWISDGIDDGKARDFASGLQGLANGKAAVSAIMPSAAQLPLALTTPGFEAGQIRVSVLRAPGEPAGAAEVTALAGNGRSFGDVKVNFAAGATSATGVIELPTELRNEVGRITIKDERNAAAVFMMDDRWRRKTVALMAGTSVDQSERLLAPLYYVSRALEPYAEVSEPADTAALKAALDQGLSMLVLADIGVLPAEQEEMIARWVENGGVLVRFAGLRFARAQDRLVPVTLRAGDRALGSALSWESPQPMQAFPDKSPFAGLTPDPTVKVSRQVLAEPDSDLPGKVWASLADGTPLVTASKDGKGLLVLFHVTANADWSNLPVTGLFVDMLQRMLDLAPAAGGGAQGGAAQPDAQAFTPFMALDGFGDFVTPAPDTQPIPAAQVDKASVTPATPPGLYRRGEQERAINLTRTGKELTPVSALPADVAVRPLAQRPVVPLAPYAFLAAALLFLADCLATLFLGGGMMRLRQRRAALTGMLALAALAAWQPVPGHAQSADDFALQNALETRLAYVRTGDADVDGISNEGLKGLSEMLRERTSVNVGEPAEVNIEHDELVFFPLLYWPIRPEATVPSDAALARIDAYMKGGGTILFDLREDGAGADSLSGGATAASEALRRILAKLDIPALEPVPPTHVLTKSFYLLDHFPGRYDGGKLWVEHTDSDGAIAGNTDGVSGIIIGSNDYAAAWAMDLNGDPLYAVVPGTDRQREFAFRTGINIVMYALTGNYKADQVHVPDLLERLGQ
ncbi:hypothetical protein DK847_01060 [Aestuariivirga litoralis]|uniref:RNA-binding protein n=1 Tax=Aestuariivirga litoralis TaxID=2650924 RepID=A0A2W2BE00_9HYPH|nr:DUF4159 domain-containing protein [Aestuariivirga litoralis]PZF78438.1 hypothetical protein DK847_01060 [Aestuariivirga litoralis]